tara:strand:+ start:471 stop:731 length:261 start_codon:yes stop_codon:yes gene_type:complete
MDVNQLISVVKKKIETNINTQNISIEDKTYLHANHKSHQSGRFHLKIMIKSIELEKINKIESTKIIYKILDKEIKQYIHSLQILIN